MVRDAGEVWSRRCRAAGVRLRLDLTAGDDPVVTDAGRLRQIIDGLAENALRAMSSGAPMVLATRRESDGVTIEVRDGGPGLSDDDLAVAFDRSALHRRYVGRRQVGSGIGLALIAGLVRRLGGTIEAGHAEEGGARFTVMLPRNQSVLTDPELSAYAIVKAEPHPRS